MQYQKNLTLRDGTGEMPLTIMRNRAGSQSDFIAKELPVPLMNK